MSIAFQLVSQLLLTAAPDAGPGPVTLPKTECAPLPGVRSQAAFMAGERLEFELDALGAVAGQLKIRTMPAAEGTLPLEVHAETSQFFAKIRRVKGLARSYLNPKTFRPVRYVEEATENEIHKTADVAFSVKERRIRGQFTI